MNTHLPRFLSQHQLDPAITERELKRVYARLLKQLDLELQAEQFQALRSDYEAACVWVRGRADAAGLGAAGLMPEADSASNAITSSELTSASAESATATMSVANQPTFRQGAYQQNRTNVYARSAVSPGVLAEDNFRELKRVVRRVGLSTQAVQLDREQRPKLMSHAGDQVADVLQKQLQKPEFLNLEAVRLFEAQIIYFLAGGWQIGNQYLFEAASKAFNWSASSDLQRQFAEAGGIIDQVLLELSLMDDVTTSERQIYDQLHERLRTERYQDLGFLNERRAPILTLYGRYRCLTFVISDYKKLEQWVHEIERLPVEKIATKVMPDKQRVAKPWFGSPWLVFVLLMILIRACASTMSNQNVTPSGYSYSTNPEAYSGPGNSSEAANRLSKAMSAQTGIATVPDKDYMRPFYEQSPAPASTKPK